MLHGQQLVTEISPSNSETRSDHIQTLLLVLELIDLLSSLPKSSKGISPGGTNPDLNLSITRRES